MLTGFGARLRKMNTSIKVTHKGLDYYKVEVDGVEYEVSLEIGKHVVREINSLVKLIIEE